MKTVSPRRSPTAVSRIAGTGRYLPSKVVTNRDLERLVETSDEWIVERTGIRERRVAAEGELTSDMAVAAAWEALAAAEIRPDELDLVIVATVTPDMPLPATAMFVQAKLGTRADCPGFDLGAACAGFIYGLSIADQYVRTGAARHVLVVGAELLSRVLDYSDRGTCVLFGDGAGAVVVSATDSPDRGLLSTHLYADPSLVSALRIPAGGAAEPASTESVAHRRHYVQMSGRDIFKFAVKALVGAGHAAMEANGLGPADVHWVIPHQANRRILEAVSARCEVPFERFYMNIERYGNTSSASVPIALDEAVRGNYVRRGENVVLCALGAGIAWGSALIRW